MARKITADDIERINILYLELKVKKRVAEVMGISPSTVSKYIIEGFKAPVENAELPPFDESKINTQAWRQIGSWQEFCDSCILTEAEWNEMKEIQKEVMI